ncbi:succinate dehydrogenase, cytochrome b556 subunit [Plastorhodobacter daqingensis]|uniref:Succinate dehydrogenase cytochrome b556 subunit n=1 Tax=Plastorhodobacter daqingensis TaxID=1387281 RepID=A0ABW2UKL6_9RHOB
MADVNRGNRPLSPFMIGTYYRPQITSVLSILHRITGVALTLAAVLVVWWLVAAAMSPSAFARADWVLTSWIGTLVLLGSLWALWFHMLNGIRHLVWDTGRGIEMNAVTTSGWAAVAGSVVATLVTILLV